MLDLLPAPETVVAMRVTGRVDEQDIERGIQAIEAALAREQSISLLVEIAITGMTAGAFTRDLGYGLGKLRDLHRFSRMAVVTGQDWLRTLAQVQDRILPHVDVRAFSPLSGTRLWTGCPNLPRNLNRKRNSLGQRFASFLTFTMKRSSGLNL